MCAAKNLKLPIISGSNQNTLRRAALKVSGNKFSEKTLIKPNSYVKSKVFSKIVNPEES